MNIIKKKEFIQDVITNITGNITLHDFFNKNKSEIALEIVSFANNLALSMERNRIATWIENYPTNWEEPKGE